ncbi:hypothetical protein BOTBODRAFT_610501 [Botryobasidium botryosum FD-172 SS1]|uniref:Uncharacterized protein n=1 Tax=Botryobasidium botryosum (strain FD-172 SS1) TaxID=930990 RepID=A0A067LW22_BOTB1|nr:hypothetical protein BOTBODRAFT_610501 [Botryobasidium botryosum FD-172 SS1]
MATFEDGHSLYNPPPAGGPVSNGVHLGPGDMRLQLQALLDEKVEQLKLTGTLGQRILAQQMELDERITQIHQLDQANNGYFPDGDDASNELREKLEELSQKLQQWNVENEQLRDGLALGAPASRPSSFLYICARWLTLDNRASLRRPNTRRHQTCSKSLR